MTAAASTGAAGGWPGRSESVTGVQAPAKLTVWLRVTGRRPDGYHLLESEMVTLDLADTLVLGPVASSGVDLTVALEFGGVAPADGQPSFRPDTAVPSTGNLVHRALEAVGRTASVRLVKRIPPGAGLGGGSADAAAVLRWAGCRDAAVAAALGADVPFCLAGGRALVRGIGEQVTPLPYEDRAFTLVLLPFGVDTAAVYRAFDGLTGPVGPDVSGQPSQPGANDLEEAATRVEPRLGRWRDHLTALCGRRPWLAGSGSTWFYAGGPDRLGLVDRSTLVLGDEAALVVAARTTPAV